MIFSSQLSGRSVRFAACCVSLLMVSALFQGTPLAAKGKPAIGSFSKSAGYPGALVQINGSGFGTEPGK